MVNISLDGRFLAVIVTPNLSLSLSLSQLLFTFANSSENEIEEIMFRQFNSNIWACDRKHAMHQYCRLAKAECAREASRSIIFSTDT